MTETLLPQSVQNMDYQCLMGNLISLTATFKQEGFGAKMDADCQNAPIWETDLKNFLAGGNYCKL